MRSCPEWIGKTPDSDPPQYVYERKFEASKGRCEICGRDLRGGEPFDLDHIKRVRDGGANRESNLQVACRWCHPIKTAEENKRGAKGARNFVRHHGLKKPKKPWPMAKEFKRKVSGAVVRRSDVAVRKKT